MAVTSVTNTTYDAAIARQTFTNASAGCPFQKFLKEAAKDVLAQQGQAASGEASGGNAAAKTGTTGDAAGKGEKLKDRLNELMAVSFIAPMLEDALTQFEQTYFANSPTEQAFTRQLVQQIASKVGQSGRMSLDKYVAVALQKRLEANSKEMEAAGTETTTPTTDVQG